MYTPPGSVKASAEPVRSRLCVKRRSARRQDIDSSGAVTMPPANRVATHHLPPALYRRQP